MALKFLSSCDKRIHGPLLGWTYDQSLEQLTKEGLTLALLPGVTRAARVAAWDFAHALREGGPPAWTEFQRRVEGHPMAGFGIFDFLGFPKIREMEELYLPESDLTRKYGESSGVYEPGMPTKPAVGI